MNPSGTLLKVGLTGGIASGKSTVAAHLASLGAFVVDADRIGHEILAEDGAAYKPVVERFGRGILDAQGQIVRQLLAQAVFEDREGLDALNAIVHPKIRAESLRRFQLCAREGRSWLIVYDAALLVETGAHRDFDRLVVVHCSRETQVARLQLRDGMSEHDANARIAAQAPVEDKLELADYTIDTDEPLASTLAQTEQLYEQLRRDFETLRDRGHDAQSPN